MKKILVLHGPNLNLLGEREPSVYGTTTLSEIDRGLRAYGRTKKITLRFFQANGEGDLIDALHSVRKWADGIVFNPGAYTHYSYALRDAVAAISVPTVEVHLSAIRKREKFRRISVIAPVCLEQISGFGPESYRRGIDVLLDLRLNQANSKGRMKNGR